MNPVPARLAALEISLVGKTLFGGQQMGLQHGFAGVALPIA